MTRGFLDEDRVQQVRLVDIAVVVRRESAKSWLVFDGSVEVWLPKSQCELSRDGTITVPEWLAQERGLI